MRSAAAYAEQLTQLLPPGPAWPREPDTLLGRLLQALADELARVDGRAFNLLDEADPLTALELLGDWERVAGLPDPCIPIATTTRERQIAVARKISGIGGQSIPFFEELAARLGLEVEIVEHRPFRAGCAAGLPVYGEAWAHAFTVRALPPSDSSNDPARLQFVAFRAGAGHSGDRLRSFGAADLECVIGRAAPAHAAVLFAYPQEPEPALWFSFL